MGCCVPTFFWSFYLFFFVAFQRFWSCLTGMSGGLGCRVSDLFRLEELQDAAKKMAGEKKNKHQDSQIS